mmetsp:Transcript_19123/g.28641  ORF Transcript_19123/g.28641 Transcript_19123/m.28641 type:complete len:210 (-) Transcript_19123:93-722(-)
MGIGRSIRPILSVGMNFYVRVFVEVNSHGPSVKNLSCSIGTVYQSVRCPSYHVVPNGQCSERNIRVIQPTRAPMAGMEKCGEAGGPFKTAGPIWLGPLHDGSVIEEAIGRLENLMDKKKKQVEKEKKKEQIKEVTQEKQNEGETTSTKEEEAGGGSSTERINNDYTDDDDDDDNVEFKYIKMDKQLHGLLTMVSEELNDAPLVPLCHSM